MTIEQLKVFPLTVLLAEDNGLNLFFLRSIIEQHFQNATILEAQDGSVAIDYYKKYMPDLILMDLNMPLIKGDVAAKEIRKLANANGHYPKIILLSGRALTKDAGLLADISVDAFLLKPFQAETLKALLNDQITHLSDDMTASTSAKSLERTNDRVGHFDYDELLQALAFDQTLVREILTHTFAYLEQFPAKFEQQLSTKKQSLIRQLAHDLAGLAANARLDHLKNLAQQIEQKDTFDPDFLQIMLKRIKEEIHAVLPILSSYTKDMN